MQKSARRSLPPLRWPPPLPPTDPGGSRQRKKNGTGKHYTNICEMGAKSAPGAPQMDPTTRQKCAKIHPGSDLFVKRRICVLTTPAQSKQRFWDTIVTHFLQKRHLVGYLKTHMKTVTKFMAKSEPLGTQWLSNGLQIASLFRPCSHPFGVLVQTWSQCAPGERKGLPKHLKSIKKAPQTSRKHAKKRMPDASGNASRVQWTATPNR